MKAPPAIKSTTGDKPCKTKPSHPHRRRRHAGPAGYQAQGSFPDKLITFVVPFRAGPSDAMARILATERTKELGQSVIVDNRAGAGGNISADAARAPRPTSHHHVWHIWAAGHQPEPVQGQKYDARTSFEPIVCGLPAQHPGGALRPGREANVQELIAKERPKPGTLNYASSGSGISSHPGGACCSTR